VVATDVSEKMLAYALKKSKGQQIENIEFKNAGFLNLDVAPQPFDAVVSQLALHHLPDFWKSVAVHNIFKVLKNGG